MPDRQSRDSGRDIKPLAPPPTTQRVASPSAPQPEPRSFWLGLPPLHWSLTLLGLCTFTFAIVTYKFPVGNVGIALAALGLFLQPNRLRVPFPVWLFGAFVLWAFIASFDSRYPGIARDKALDYLKLLAIMLVVANALQTEGQLRFYLLFLLGCFVLFPVRGTLLGGDSYFGRAVWNYIYRNSNDLATLCLIALGISLAFMLAQPARGLVRLGAAVSTVLILVVILLTKSRGAFIGFVVAMGPALFRLGLKRPRFLVIAVVIGLAVGSQVPPDVFERLAGIQKLTSTATIAEADPEGSAAERFSVQKVAWRIFLDHPVFGVGLGAYPLANARYAPDLGQMDTHNTYLNLAAEVGLPGLMLWLACFGSVLRYAYRCRRLAAPSVLATQQGWVERGLLAYLVAGAVGTYAKLSFPYLILVVLWCSASLLASRSLPTNTSTRATSL